SSPAWQSPSGSTVVDYIACARQVLAISPSDCSRLRSRCIAVWSQRWGNKWRAPWPAISSDLANESGSSLVGEEVEDNAVELLALLDLGPVTTVLEDVH